MPPELLLPPRFKYQRVEIALRRLTAMLPTGTRLPSEKTLGVSHCCNFLTVRRALKDMVDEGVVVRRVGSGTFVAPRLRPRIGVLVRQRGDKRALKVLQSLARAGVRMDVELRFTWARDFTSDGLRHVAGLVETGCSALALPCFHHDQIEDIRAFVRACSIPVCLPVTISGPSRVGRPPTADEILRREIELGCDHLQSLGCRRIAFIGPGATADPARRSALDAYLGYVSRHRLTDLVGLVASGPADFALLAHHWREYRGDLAIMACDDEHALAFITAMRRLGLRAPLDFRIIGRGDTAALTHPAPDLSSVARDIELVGHWLLAHSLALAHGETTHTPPPPEPRLLVRATCGGERRF